MSPERENQKPESRLETFMKTVAPLLSGLKGPVQNPQELQDPQELERAEKLKEIKLKVEGLSLYVEIFGTKDTRIFNDEPKMVQHTESLYNDIRAIFDMAEPLNILPDYEYKIWERQMNAIREIFDLGYMQPGNKSSTRFGNYYPYMLELIEEIQDWAKTI